MVASKLVRTEESALKREIGPGQPGLGAPFTNLSICRRRGDYMPGHPGSVFCGFFSSVHWVLRTYSGSSTTLASVWAEDDVLTVCFRALLTRKRAFWAVLGLFASFAARAAACLIVSSLSSSSSVSLCPEKPLQPPPCALSCALCPKTKPSPFNPLSN